VIFQPFNQLGRVSNLRRHFWEGVLYLGLTNLRLKRFGLRDYIEANLVEDGDLKVEEVKGAHKSRLH
jgi:hypothetical protein